MIAEGQVVLFRFSQTDQTEGKLRPALILRQLPGQYDDWLICMISSQLHQEIPDLDEIITPDDSDFKQSGLKLPSEGFGKEGLSPGSLVAATDLPNEALVFQALVGFGVA
jgi:hypothetical protein